MAKCDYCKCEMLEVDDCSANREVEFSDGTKLASVPYKNDENVPCHDCGISVDNYHHPGCDSEECPRCGVQIISCNCLIN